MPLAQIVEAFWLVTHTLMEPLDEFPMLDWVALEMRFRAIALNGQIDYEKAPVTNLLCSEDAAYLAQTSGVKLAPQLVHTPAA